MNNGKILLVEDDPITALAERRTLENNGYQVFHANSGEEAINFIKSDTDIVLILMDIILGTGIDGIETAKRILADKDIPIIFLSSHIEPAFVEKTEGIDCYGYVVKNTGETVLIASIRMALRLFETKLNEKVKEKALLESEERSCHLFERAPLGYQSLDEKGYFIDVNNAWLETLGYEREEVIGRWFGDFLAPEFVDLFNTNFPLFKKAGKIHTEFKMIHKSGKALYIAFDGRIGLKEDGSFEQTHCILQDVTEKKESEEKIKVLLNEKELLLKETHHRVKNNMNTVHSLLYLQSEELTDPVSKSIVQDAALRVQSMMVLYDKLYRSENHHEINVNYYLPSHVEEIVRIFDSPIPLKTEIQVEDIVLNAKTLSALGIIINELITNSMKYAFTNVSEGLISLSLKGQDNKVTVAYSDNGPGLPESVNFENSTGFGMQLINMLVQQLEGTISIDRSQGVGFVLEFDV